MVVHDANRPFQCNDCGKRFPRRQSLKLHVRIMHTGVRKFKCDLCDAAYGEKTSLVRHMAQHADSKPAKMYKCYVCLEVFDMCSQLTAHKHTHKILQCKFCDKVFKRYQPLKQHVLFLLGAGKMCDVCD